MWKLNQIYENAEREKKGDYGIFKFYLMLLREAKEVVTPEDWINAKNRLRDILEVEE